MEGTDLSEQVQGLVPRDENTPAPLEQTFRSGSGFESATWVNLGDFLRIKFKDDHQMDGFGLAHEYRTEADDWIRSWEAPKFGGEADINVFGHARSHADTFPTRKFKLIGFKGQTGIFTFVEERIASVNVIAPRSIAPADLFDDMESPEKTPSED